MSKKQILFVMLMAGCAVNGVFAEQSKGNENAHAFMLNMYPSDHAAAIEKGIPSIQEINGVDVWRWLYDEAHEMNTENVTVVKQLENGKFSDGKKLSEFSVEELRRCFWVVSSVDGRLYGSENRNEYAAEHLSLIENLKQGNCDLCTEFNKTVIVTNAQGSPEKVCNKLNLEERYLKNVHRRGPNK